MAQLDPRREKDVTASDVPSIVGESPWKNRRSVLFDKTFGIRQPESDAMRHGHYYEPVAIKKFCDKTGAKVEYPGYVKHKKFQWFGGTVDGVATMPDGSRCVIEVKCPVSRKITDEVPAHYIGQVQSYLELLDLDTCLFVQYKPPGPRKPEEFLITNVKRDRGYMESRLPSLLRFWMDLHVHRAYAHRIVTVIQRAWLACLARRRLGEAIRGSMVARLRCAQTVGKFAGFFRRKKYRALEVPQATGGEFIFVDVSGSGVRAWWRAPPPEAARPIHNGDCFVYYSQEARSAPQLRGPHASDCFVYQSQKAQPAHCSDCFVMVTFIK
jgi:putative phage-type endonuclease